VVHDGLYLLFYDLGFGYRHPVHPRAYRICVAKSRDGIHWQDATENPVLAPGEPGAWDDAWVSQACVIQVGNWWYMMYAGQSRRAENKDGQAFGLARAPCPLGPWIKYPGNPIFQAASDVEAWDGRFVQQPCLVRAGTQWRLYYNGYGGRPLTYRVGWALLQD
jgi:predicted GH43/DUF377 family glycosyl hydrolase